MSEPLLAYAEPSLQWRTLARYRPEAGLAFEKHTWLFPPCVRPVMLVEPLFEHAGGIVIRERRLRLDDGREVPLAAAVDEMALPALARVAIAGPGSADFLGALLAGEDAILHCPDFAARAAAQLIEPPETPQPGLFRIPSGQTGVACATIAAEPRAYLLASPALPMSMRRLRTLLDLSRGTTLPFTEFGELVTSCRWLATSLASTQVPVTGLVLYGGADLIAAVERAAAACSRSLRWLEVPWMVEARPSLIDHASLPALSDLPLAANDRLDVSGYNLAELPPRGSATELVLDDTAVVDLAPLGGWKELTSISLRGLGPLSLAPIAGVKRLRLGYVEQAHVAALSDFGQLEELRLEGTPLANPGPLTRCKALRSLELRHTPLATLQGIEALDSLERLRIETALPPAGLERLADLPRLRELAIHVSGRFDLSQLPRLPSLERLEICGLDDRNLELDSTDRLTLYPALKSLALRATNVTSLEWLAQLAQLTELDLAATDIEDLSPIRSAPQLRRLDLLLVPATDISPVAELSGLEVLDLSSVPAFQPGLLAQLPRLEELHLGGAPLRTLLDLPPLPRLRVLDLAQTTLEALTGLENLPALDALDLSGTQLEDVRLLGEQRSLRKLLLIDCRISDLAPLASLTALEELSLFATQVSNLQPLAHCNALQKLSLARLTLDDLGPLAALARLETLDLHDARFTELTSVGTLFALRTLDISGTSPGSLIPLRGLERLRALHASHLPHTVDLSPILDLPPLALLRLSQVSLSQDLKARLAVRHHLVIASE